MEAFNFEIRLRRWRRRRDFFNRLHSPGRAELVGGGGGRKKIPPSEAEASKKNSASGGGGGGVLFLTASTALVFGALEKNITV